MSRGLPGPVAGTVGTNLVLAAVAGATTGVSYTVVDAGTTSCSFGSGSTTAVENPLGHRSGNMRSPGDGDQNRLHHLELGHG